jgi:hypothetical protein
MKRMMMVMALMITCAAGAANAQAPVADFFSATSTMDGGMLPMGTTIEAYDAQNIRCGYAMANADGSFLIHVYGNDPITPAIDEGAQDGEMLTWKMEGVALTAAQTLWISNIIGAFSDIRWENGAAKQIQLDGHTTAVEATSWSSVKESYRR